jgi:hypothetical protein
VNAAEFAERTRAHVSCEVTHNMKWLAHHLRELQSLLRGETLSQDAWEEMCRYAADLDRLTHTAKPRLPMKDAAE